MSAIIHSLGLDQLTRADQLRVVHELWDHIAAESAKPMLTDAQRAELERREEQDDADPEDVITWDEVKVRVAARLRS
jgi:putative addiction module component (TIGR02574 family)